MKIRTGFVSNSSSSSFILTIRKKFESIDDLYRSIWNFIYFRHNNELFNDERDDNEGYTYDNVRLQKFLNDHHIEVKLNNSDYYELSTWTPMYNDSSDIPEAFTLLTLDYILNGYNIDLKAESDY